MTYLPAPTTTPVTRARGVALGALVLASFAVNLDTTIVNVALPSLVRELHATTTQLQWVVDAYNLVFAALILTSGSLSDRFGRKGMLIAGLAVFGVGSVLAGFTSSPDQLIALRAVMGLGGAMVFPATLSSITNLFPDRAERAKAIGLWGASAGAAIAMGPLVGGWLLEHYSWSSIFYVMAPVAAAAIALVAWSVPETRDPDAGRIDLAGFAGSTVAMGVLVYTVIEAPDHGWLRAGTLGGFALAAVVFGAFIVVERRTPEPMLDLSLFSNARFSAASASVTVAFFTLFGFIFLITQYFQFIKGYSPLGTGVRLLPVATCVGVSSVIGTRMAVRFGSKAVVTAGLACIVAFYLWVWAVIGAHTNYAVIAAQMVVYGIGMGLTSAPATESIMGAVATAKAGVGSAVNDATRLLGGTLGVAIIGSVYNSLFTGRLATLLPHSLPSPAAAAARQSVGAALAVARQTGDAGHAALATAVRHSATTSFVHGISVASLVAAGVAALGAVSSLAFLPAQPPGEAAATADGRLLVVPAPAGA